ncbi:hypothetical protein CC1G_04982 [Coprinopsis cinerea okayama7|uniref:F-box domain-containing protein n=1 Tax=Coprinopsis cinerea (strain Okayama-7 / 130 / ATCC MYA-4618 / FGSC 9003) TaxID=240176 RepID=A8NSD8_COPC7|nr:hypothetical protein CC1G_04982 [Coprinopsis cinerea okayama7\|eukprot:XP_001835989.1 hypothetical protein CC1G_04982 [Coprinopsis cinerea okayama7\
MVTEIATHVDNDPVPFRCLETLKACSLVCRAFHNEFSKRVASQIHVRDTVPEDDSDDEDELEAPRRCLHLPTLERFKDYIEQNPHFADQVRVFKVTLHVHWQKLTAGTSFNYVLPATLDLLAQILPLLPRLQHFWLQASNSIHWDEFEPLQSTIQNFCMKTPITRLTVGSSIKDVPSFQITHNPKLMYLTLDNISIEPHLEGGIVQPQVSLVELDIDSSWIYSDLPNFYPQALADLRRFRFSSNRFNVDSVQTILSKAGPALQEFECKGCCNTQVGADAEELAESMGPFDFSSNTQLREIHFRYFTMHGRLTDFGPRMCTSLESLSGSTSKVERITLEFAVTNEDALVNVLDFANWTAIERVMQTPSAFPSLRSFNIVLSGLRTFPICDKVSIPTLRTQVRRLFPQFHDSRKVAFKVRTSA